MDVWVYNIGTYVFPFSLILGDQSLARMLGTAFCMLVGGMSVIYTCRKGWKNNAWMITVPILLLFMNGQPDMQYMQAAYAPNIAIMPFMLLMLFNVCRQEKEKKYYIIYVITSLVFCMAGIRQFAEHVIPAWMAAMLLIWEGIRTEEKPELKNNIREAFRRSLWIAVPAVLGIAAYAAIIFTHNITGMPKGNGMLLPGSFREIIDILLTVISGIYSTMGYKGGTPLLSPAGIASIVSLVMCTIVIFIVPVLQALKLKEEEGFTKFFFYFTLVHNAIMLIMSVFLGFYTTSYYMITSIYACMILSGRYIYVYWIEQKGIARYAWIMLFGLAVILQGAGLVSGCRGWKEKLAEAEALPQELAAMGLTKGYADYWDAYKNEVYSDFKTTYCAVEISDANVRPYYFLNDASIYEPSEGKSFFLLGEKDFGRMEMILQKFGETEQLLDRGKYKVLIYDHDIATDMKKVLDDGVIDHSELMPVVIYDELKYTEESVVVRSGQQINSEFVPMSAGRYIIEYDADKVNDLNLSVVSRTHRWGLVSLSDIGEVDGKRRAELVLKKDQPLMEFRISNNGTDSVNVYGIRVITP